MIPYFSIIIPTLNEEVNLPILLSSIKNQTFTDFEVIISDDISADLTKTNAFEFYDKIKNFNFLEYKSKNVSKARNYGAKYAKGEYLIFFDADTEIERDFLKEIKNKIDIYNLDVVTIWNRTKSKEVSSRILLGLLNITLTLFQKIKPAATGACIIIKKGLFEKIGGFDETIVFGEDFNLIQKAHKFQARFAVFRHPVLYVSTRRFKKEGFFVSLYKSIKAIMYQLLIGPIRKPIFKYEMGGQYFKDKSE